MSSWALSRDSGSTAQFCQGDGVGSMQIEGVQVQRAQIRAGDSGAKSLQASLRRLLVMDSSSN